MTIIATAATKTSTEKAIGTTETLNTKRAKLLAIARGGIPTNRQVTVEQPKTEKVEMPKNVVIREQRNQLIGAKFTRSMKEQILEAIAAAGHTNEEGKADVTSYLTEHFEKLVYGTKR